MPKPKSAVTSLRLTEDELDFLRTRSSELGVPIREVIMLAVRAQLKAPMKFDERGYEQGRREGKKAAIKEFREVMGEVWTKLSKKWDAP